MIRIEQDIRRFVVAKFLFGRDDAELKSDTSFIDAGIIDSMSLVELIGFLGDRYGIVVDDDELTPENFDSIDCIRRFAERKLSAARNGELRTAHAS
jgi:acyl carrier protein